MLILDIKLGRPALLRARGHEALILYVPGPSAQRHFLIVEPRSGLALTLPIQAGRAERLGFAGEAVSITPLGIHRSVARVGFEAPPSVEITRRMRVSAVWQQQAG